MWPSTAVNPVDGILYPRAGTLGGCTAHNAMILVYPHDADWDNIATLTGDASWGANNMRKYFQRIENCHYRLPFIVGCRGWESTRRVMASADGCTPRKPSP